jgi:hypothetical protein
MEILLILLKGYIFLICAILFNYLLGIFKIKNWYYLLYNFKNPRLNSLDVIFLFVIYPLFLGVLVIALSF